MTPDEYAERDVTDLAALVRAREVTPDQLRAAATAMYERTHDRINAVLEWYDEPTPVPSALLSEAPLAGVPFLRKDYGSAEAGRLVEMGSRLAQGLRAPNTGEYIRRLQDAGTQILGRSAVPEFILHGTTESVVNGATRNPFNPALSAGGSSGGSAAAVAAGVVPFAHASDCAGSIRIPAAACGLIGLKPSRRRVPWEEGGWGGIAEEFVVTKTVRDTQLLLGVLGDGPMLDAVGPLRVAVSLDHWGGHEADAQVVDATRRVGEALESFGHHLTEIEMPVDYEQVGSTWHPFFSRWVLRDAERAAAESGRPIDLDHVELMGMHSIEAARQLTAADITTAQDTQGLITRRLELAMADHDVLLTPTLGRASIPLGTVAGDVAEMDTYMDEGDALMPYNFLFNITGWPAISVPAGWAEIGVPLGVQLAAPIGHEPVLLRLAAELESVR